MSTTTTSRGGRETVSPAHSAREQSSPALSRNLSPATSDPGYHRSGRSSAHSSENYPYYPERQADGPPGPPSQHQQASKAYPQEYNQGYGPHGRSDYGPEHGNQVSSQSYEYNKMQPHHPTGSIMNRGSMYGKEVEYDKYRQWRQEQKSLATAAHAHAARYPAENRYQEKSQRNNDPRGKNYPVTNDRQQQPSPQTQKRPDNPKDMGNKPTNRSRKPEPQQNANSNAKSHEKPKHSDAPKTKVPKPDNLFEAMAKSKDMSQFASAIEKGQGGITPKDLVDVPLSLFYLPYYPMGLTEKLAKIDEEKAKEEWLASHLTDEQGLELLRKKFPNFPHDIPKNSEIFRKLPNGVRFHRTEDLPGSREAVTRSLPVANVNPIIKEADGKEVNTGKMSVSDIIAAKISEGLQPPPSNQQSIQEPGTNHDSKEGVKGEKQVSNSQDKDEDSKQSWSQVRDIASLFFPFHMIRKKDGQSPSGKSDSDGKKSPASHTNFAKYIESAIAKNLKLENGEDPNESSAKVDQVDLTKDEDEKDAKDKEKKVSTSDPPTPIKRPPEATISKPPTPAPEDKKPEPEQDTKTTMEPPKTPVVEETSRPATPDVKKNTSSASEPKRNMYKSRKHYFLHRHLATENDEPTQDEINEKPEVPKTDDEKTQDSFAQSEPEEKKPEPIKTEDIKQEQEEKVTEEKPAEDDKKSPMVKSDSFDNDQYKHERNIPKYPDSDSDDTWLAKTPMDMSPARSSPCYTPLEAPSSPVTQPSSPENKPDNTATQPKNDQGRRRGRGRGSRGGRRSGTARGRPPKPRAQKDKIEETDKASSSTTAAKQSTQSKNADEEFGQGTSKVGYGQPSGTSKHGFCPSKTKLLKRLASREMQKERENKKGRSLTVRRASAKKRHEHDEVSLFDYILFPLIISQVIFNL